MLAFSARDAVRRAAAVVCTVRETGGNAKYGPMVVAAVVVSVVIRRCPPDFLASTLSRLVKYLQTYSSSI